MKKKLLLIVISISLLGLLGGCGKKVDNGKADTTDKNTEESKTDDNSTEDNSVGDISEDIGTDIESELVVVEKEDFVAKDYITLGNYKGIEYTVQKLEVSDDDVEDAINEELQAAAEEKDVTDRTVVENGDTVNIDYEGLKDGVAFAGGTAAGQNLIIGSGSFIPGFEEGLIGATVGEKIDLDITFPEAYQQSPELAGQPVVFKVTVNAIKEIVIPELTEEYVKDTLGLDNIKAYKEEVRKELEDANEATMDNERINNIFQQIIEASVVSSYPQSLIDFYKAELKNNYIQYAYYNYGMKYADFLEASGVTEEEFDADALSYAENMAKQEMVFTGIIETENLGLTDEEFETCVAKIAADYEYATTEELLASIEEDQIRESLLWQKVLDLVVAEAKEK
ncbi:MAG: trigger factor [Clostridiales bacterium]|nr:trigger factor [Clostridiales bacterium]